MKDETVVFLCLHPWFVPWWIYRQQGAFIMQRHCHSGWYNSCTNIGSPWWPGTVRLNRLVIGNHCVCVVLCMLDVLDILRHMIDDASLLCPHLQVDDDRDIAGGWWQLPGTVTAMCHNKTETFLSGLIVTRRKLWSVTGYSGWGDWGFILQGRKREWDWVWIIVVTRDGCEFKCWC